MKLSKLARIYEFGGEDKFYYVIRHSILNKSFIFSEEEYEQLIDSLKSGEDNDVIQELRVNHIIVGNNYKEEKFIDFLKDNYNSNKFSLEIVYLIFTSNCNLKCKYCYVEKSTDPKFSHQSMDEPTFEKTMTCIERIISKANKKKINFIFYGSEPLMAKDMISKSLERISAACKNTETETEFNITTNGTLFDNQILEIFKKYKVKVSVSLDGPKEVNDQMRVTQENHGTFEEISSSLEMLNEKEIPFGISCTIGPHNINTLKENIELFKKMGATSIGFNILLNARYYKIPQVPLNKLNDNLIAASEVARLQGIYEDRVQRKYRAFHNSIPRLKDCGGVGNQLVFFPNGDIGVCEAHLCNRKYEVGTVDDFELDNIKNNDIIKLWTERYPLNMPECTYCPAIGICGGGCPFNAETRMKNLKKLDKPFCIHTTKILDWLLEKSVSEKTGEKDLYMRDISFMFQ